MLRDDALLNESAAPTAREIDRRTIAKGVAWTVPVVIVATAAPAAAGSANPSPTTFVSSTGHQNGLSVKANFTLFFTGSASSTVVITSVTSTGDTWTWPTGPLALSAGSKGQLKTTFTGSRTRSTAATVTITFKIDGGFEQTTTVTI